MALITLAAFAHSLLQSLKMSSNGVENGIFFAEQENTGVCRSTVTVINVDTNNFYSRMDKIKWCIAGSEVYDRFFLTELASFENALQTGGI